MGMNTSTGQSLLFIFEYCAIVAKHPGRRQLREYCPPGAEAKLRADVLKGLGGWLYWGRRCLANNDDIVLRQCDVSTQLLGLVATYEVLRVDDSGLCPWRHAAWRCVTAVQVLLCLIPGLSAAVSPCTRCPRTENYNQQVYREVLIDEVCSAETQN